MIQFKQYNKKDKRTLTIITANSRLSEHFQQQYDELQIQQGLETWEACDVIPFQAWLKKIYTYLQLKLTQLPLLLNSLQEETLWDMCLTEVEHEPFNFLNRYGIAREMREAWQFINDWQLNPDKIDFNQVKDGNFFKKTLFIYKKKLATRNCLDQASLIHHLISHIARCADMLPKTLYITGFDDFCPTMICLFNAIEKVNIKIYKIENFNAWLSIQTGESPIKKAQSQCFRVGFQNSNEECLTMALFAKQALKENPALKIGFIVPQIVDEREIILNTFQRVFAEESEKKWFNMTLGKPLLSYPIVQTAFDLLACPWDYIEYQHVQRICLSPYIKFSEKELSSRALFESQFRQRAKPYIKLKYFQKECSNHCPELAKMIQYYINERKKHSEIASIRHYADLFVHLLRIWGWPGELSYSHEEYKIVEQALPNLIDHWLTLDSICGAVSYEKALSTLRHLASQTIYQPETSEQVPIQIMGTLEASGFNFDYVWVKSLDEQRWPSSPAPNAFLPYDLQRKLKMPRSSTEREWSFCQTLQQRFIKSAQHVIFSYSCIQDEEPLYCSPLIAGFPEKSKDELALYPWLSVEEKIFNTKTVAEDIETAIPLKSQDEKLTGGVSIIREQSACSFKAFALFRLKIKSLNSIEPGLNALERGSIIHQTLQSIWNDLKEHKTLCHLSKNELFRKIEDHIQWVVNKEYEVKSLLLEIEKERLRSILLQWLEFEAQRSPFKVVGTEIELKTQLANLPLQIRLDRIDELENGEWLLIDYKIGDISTQAWFGERLEEPQLPLYCVSQSQAVHALAFARIHYEDFKFKGISKHPIELKGIQVFNPKQGHLAQNFDEQKRLWKVHLEQLAQQFTAGDISINPRDGAKTCNFCDLQILCRVYERQMPSLDCD